MYTQVYVKYWWLADTCIQTNPFSRETDIEIQRKWCTTSRTCYKCASMISRQDRLLYFPRFTKTCSTVSFGYDRHNSAMHEVWRHRRVTLTESRPSGSIATGKGNQERKFFSYIFMRKSLTAKRSIEISILPGNREV